MIEDGLYDRLTNYAGLVALISDRVYADHLPQLPTRPAVAYSKQSSSPRSLLATDTDVYDTVFDIGCFSTDYDTSNNVAKEVVSAVQRYSGTNAGMIILDGMILDVSNDYEDDLEIYETSVTIKLTHRDI